MKKLPNPTDRHVGSRVRMIRMMRSMSQEDMGDALGLTFQQVQKYEKGTNRMGASRLQQIATVVGVSIGFFFEGLPDPGANPHHAAKLAAVDDIAPEVVSGFLATRGGLDLAAAFMEIPSPKIRAKVVELVESIAGEAYVARRGVAA